MTSIMATSSFGEGNRYPDVSVGVHEARCVRVIDLGTQKAEYQGDVSWKRQCMIIWEVPSETNKDEPLTISKFYTLSLHEKSNLGIDLTAWRGRAFTEMEKQGFDISKLCGVPCMINVMEGKNGRPRVTSLMPLPKTSAIPEQFHESIVFSIDEFQKGERSAFNKLADGIRNIVLRSKELENFNADEEHTGEDIPDVPDYDDENVPF